MSEKLIVKGQDPSAETESQILAKKLVEVINQLCGDKDWSGDEPYELQAMDTEARKAYTFAIRRGEDWITIQQRESDNPSLISTYSLKKKNEAWDYIDPYKIKYDESSLPKLQDVYEKMQKILELSKPKKIDGDRNTSNRLLE